MQEGGRVGFGLYTNQKIAVYYCRDIGYCFSRKRDSFSISRFTLSDNFTDKKCVAMRSQCYPIKIIFMS